jgi:transposase InsO family protein
VRWPPGERQKAKPELLADGPSQVLTWDTTKLRDPAGGIFYQLYVLIDIYSRFNPSWIVSPVEQFPAGRRLHRRSHRLQRRHLGW